jgi:ketosteroid isomerase-like protein
MRRQVENVPIVGVLSISFAYIMPNQPTSEIELLRAAYAAFNVRDLDAALALMTPDVHWPRAFKGGFVCGPEEVRAYWTEQGSEIDAHVEPVAFNPEEDGQILVEVHQVVRDLVGVVLTDEHVGHRFTFKDGLIQVMEICPLESSGLGT